MSAFDDLTLAEVDEITQSVLNGKSWSDPSVDPLMLAGAVMWLTDRRNETDLSWDAFKQRTTMAAIKAFSIDMEAEAMANPLPPPT